MKETDENNLIEELFRHKLENAELIPSSSVRNKLMRRVAVREFFRFNPARFNIYYLAVILTAVTIAVFISLERDELHDAPQEKKPETNSAGSLIDELNHSPSDADRQYIYFSGLTSGNVPGTNKSENGDKISIKPDRQQIARKNLNGNPEKIEDISVMIPEISLSERIAYGQATAEKLIDNTGKSSVAIEASLLSGCAPLMVRFNNSQPLYDSCLWSFGDGGFSSDRNPVRVYETEGEYNVVLRVFDRRGRELGSSSATVTVYPKPLARFEIQNEHEMDRHGIKFINYSNNAVRFRWDFGDGTYSELYEPSHFYQTTGNYNIRLIAISEHGCSDSVKITGSAGGSGYFIIFPNAFIPNPGGPASGYYTSSSDESSSIFHPVANGVSEYQLKIFSKRGILIYESNDLNIGWDGYLNGQMCESGVYVWKATGRYLNGESFTKIGDVTLLNSAR